MMFHKIQTIKVEDGYILFICFEDGAQRRYDVSQMFERFPVFLDLRKDGLFDRVRVDQGGYGISWNDDIDIACDELYFGGESVS